MEIYVVSEGDTLWSVANRYSISPDSLAFLNQIPEPYVLVTGQALLIPATVQSDDGDAGQFVIKKSGRDDVVSNGFAYPFISRYVLEQTLPYMDELSVFSYGFNDDGTLIPPKTDDTRMIREAYEYNVRPILTLTPLGSDGRFNNNLISSLVQNGDNIETLHAELLDTMNNKGFGGINIDFEYILASDRDAFTEFVRKTAQLMRENGYSISVDLAPKVSAEQKGVLFDGKDFAALGAAADSVLSMTYEWGYKYGPPQAVAPIDQVRRTLEYAISQIESSKISIGIPNYGYDWPLPFEAGKTVARTIGGIEAVEIAKREGVDILFDEKAMSPYFTYNSYGTDHIVWFEDVRSYKAKYDLIDEYNLRGPGFWTIMRWFNAGYVLLGEMFG